MNDCSKQPTFAQLIPLIHLYANSRMASAMLEPPVSQIHSEYKVALYHEVDKTFSKGRTYLLMNTQMPRER